MKATTLCLILAAVMSAATVTSPVQGQQSFDGQADISKLLTAACEQFDTTTEDAIVLSEGQSVTWLRDGRLSTIVHRIIWINSGVTIDEYGDIRIPFDQEHCSFTPLAVRVWREGRWWPSDSTGVVETLPFALDHAYDYTGLREVMLLLNGMEAPCIAEIEYRIEDRTPFRKGATGLWLFASEEPGMESWFELGFPSDMHPHVSASAGVGAPERHTDPKSGLEIMRWQIGPHVALPRPQTVDPASDVPHVTWSTWDSWTALGALVTAGFRQDSLYDPDLNNAVDSLVRKGRTDAERAKLVARFVSDRVSFVNYPESYWWEAPRTAERIYATAYGHRLDRAILAASLFRKAGLIVHPMFVSEGFAPIESDAPSLARLAKLALHIRGVGSDAIYFPDAAGITEYATAVVGRTTWCPVVDSAPHVVAGGTGNLKIQIALTYDKSKSKFTGTGLLAGESGLCPASQCTGLGGELKAYLGSVMSDLIKGATVTEYNPERFDPSAVVVGFAVEIPKQEAADTNRISLTIGKPKGGIVDNLPRDVQLFQKDRLSTIRLPMIMSQTVEVRLDIAPSQIVYSPVTETIENEAGRFSVASEIKDSQLVVMRKLSLVKTSYLPAEWPLLRQLLLAESHDKNNLVILKTTTELDKKK